MRPDWLEKKIASHASLDGYVKPKAGDLLRLDSNENLVIPKNYIWNLFEQGSDAFRPSASVSVFNALSIL